MENKVVLAHPHGGPQGDIFLLRIPEIPKGAKKRTGKSSNVLALGEVTGHNHVIEGAEVYSLEDKLFVRVGKVGTLTHGGANPEVDFDHYRQVFEPGNYAVIRQVTEENEPMAD